MIMGWGIQPDNFSTDATPIAAGGGEAIAKHSHVLVSVTKDWLILKYLLYHECDKKDVSTTLILEEHATSTYPLNCVYFSIKRLPESIAI